MPDIARDIAFIDAFLDCSGQNPENCPECQAYLSFQKVKARVVELEEVLHRIVNEPAVMGPDARWLQSFAAEALKG